MRRQRCADRAGGLAERIAAGAISPDGKPGASGICLVGLHPMLRAEDEIGHRRAVRHGAMCRGNDDALKEKRVDNDRRDEPAGKPICLETPEEAHSLLFGSPGRKHKMENVIFEVRVCGRASDPSPNRRIPARHNSCYGETW